MNDQDEDTPVAERSMRSLTTEELFAEASGHPTCCSSSGELQDLLRDSGVTPLRLPARSPNLNAFAERFVGTVRAECLGRIVPLGEGHLRAAVRSFVDHYHEERPHQGLDNALVAPKTTSIGSGPVRCWERLGGLLMFYYRQAA